MYFHRRLGKDQCVKLSCRILLEAPLLWFSRAVAAVHGFTQTRRTQSAHSRLSTVVDNTAGSGVTVLASDYKQKKIFTWPT